MNNGKIIRDIVKGGTSLGVEFGSTRIKAVLIDSQKQPIASGSHAWKKQLVLLVFGLIH
ncbi:hypothetical protein ACVR0P_08685 [Streptococcus castoreus]|uniref:hypothetical protein n=1 Tax=Streptococcus castoreus TaxID=254786 RepID=UPI0003F85D29